MDTHPMLTQREFSQFQRLMYEKAGIRMNDSKHSLVQNRLKRRLRELGLKSYKEYFAIITDPAHADEMQECMNALTTNETYFFRHKNHWDFFTMEFIPEIREMRQDGAQKEVRVWSAAASIGAEVYSAAIAVDELLPESEGWRHVLDATDINDDVLRQAKEGVFNPYAVQKLTKRCLKKYFVPISGGEKFVVCDRLRKKVKFRTHNLLESSRSPQYDLVFLRNVLIYFDETSKAQVLNNMANKIRRGGYLILGGAESLSACRDIFDYVKPTIYRRIG